MSSDEPAWLASLDLRSPAEELTALLAALVPALDQRFTSVIASLDLNRAQAQLLVQLPPEHAVSQREMSQRLHCAPSSVVPVIDSMELRGWLTRRVDQADRRINTLMLTLDGADLRERLLQQLLDPPAAIRRLSSDQQRTLRDLLRGLIQDWTAAPGE